MYDNFENLQKKCKRYYLKKRAKKLLAIISIPLAVTIYLLLADNTQKEQKQSQVIQNVVKETKKIEKTSVTLKKPEKKILTKTDTLKKKRVIKDVPYALLIDSKYSFHKEKKVSKKTYKKEPKEIQSVYIKKEENKPVEISIKKLDSINEMIAYYEKDKKYSLAIKIAQYYYDSKQYSKSLLWAKKANLLNRDDDKAWILYAKSEYAQNNHKRAIKILKLYLTNSISNEAQSQLIIWTQGKQK